MGRKRDIIIKGFSKLLKEDKLKLVAEYFENPGEVIELLKSFWHSDESQQKLFDEFSENTITNFIIPYGIAPNVIINGRNYLVPMVIEESRAELPQGEKYHLEPDRFTLVGGGQQIEVGQGITGFKPQG